MSSISVHSVRPETYVLDSWPFLEQFRRSAFLPQMDTLLAQAERAEAVLLMSEMNLGEIFYLLARDKGETHAETVLQIMARLPIRIVPVAAGDVMEAARLKARNNISYADCFCALTAIARRAYVVTGDRDFLKLQEQGLVRVQWVGA